MITAAYDPARSNRIFGVAIAASLLTHVLFALLAFAAYDRLAHVLQRLAIHHVQPKPDDEVVMLSSAIRIEKRARPARAERAREHIAERPQRPQPLRQPRPLEVAREPAPAPAARPMPKPVVTAPPRVRRELATFDRRAPAQAPAVPPAAPGLEKKTVAFEPAQRPARQNPAQFSRGQLAQIQRDLSQSIARDRAEQNVESDAVRAVAPASTKRLALNMSGAPGMLRGYQGVCDPTTTWRSAGYDYYYLNCTIAHADGTVRYAVPVPWPVRFRPDADPWNPEGGRTAAGPGGPIALPLPGWRPPPGRTLDPDMAAYLRHNGVTF